MNDKEFDVETIRSVESIFVSLEEDYIKQLLSIPEFYEYLSEYLKYSNLELIEKFKKNQESMENGEVTEDKEDDVELEMIACVLAMADKIKRLILVKTPTYEEEEERSNGRHR